MDNNNNIEKEIRQYFETGKKNLVLVYILYLSVIISPVINQLVISLILPFVGAGFSYYNLLCSNKIWQTHYMFAFRTFCFGIVSFFVIKILNIAFLSFVVQGLLFIWIAARSIIALKLLLEEMEHPNPLTFWIK
jgi:uncharacterized membrane protein